MEFAICQRPPLTQTLPLPCLCTLLLMDLIDKHHIEISTNISHDMYHLHLVIMSSTHFRCGSLFLIYLRIPIRSLQDVICLNNGFQLHLRWPGNNRSSVLSFVRRTLRSTFIRSNYKGALDCQITHTATWYNISQKWRLEFILKLIC